MDEKFKQISDDIERLRAANQILLDKLSALKNEIQQIRAEQARLAANSIVRNDLKPLALKIEEVDKRRQEDKEAISEEIKKLPRTWKNCSRPPSPSLLQSLRSNRPPPGMRRQRRTPTLTPSRQEKTSTSIKNSYNANLRSKGKKTITLQNIRDANRVWTG